MDRAIEVAQLRNKLKLAEELKAHRKWFESETAYREPLRTTNETARVVEIPLPK